MRAVLKAQRERSGKGGGPRNVPNGNGGADRGGQARRRRRRGTQRGGSPPSPSREVRGDGLRDASSSRYIAARRERTRRGRRTEGVGRPSAQPWHSALSGRPHATRHWSCRRKGCFA